jgi:hypothetical protein
MVTVYAGLCKGRHEIVDNEREIELFIFDEPIENPNDFKNLENQAREFLEMVWNPDNQIYVYVTGLSQALTSVLKIASEFAESHNPDCDGQMLFALKHYNRDTGEYEIQTIFDLDGYHEVGL